MDVRLINPWSRPLLNADVTLQFACNLYRPTPVAMIQDAEGNMPFFRKEKNGQWGFLQGGVEDSGEDVIDALLREVWEESKLLASDVAEVSGPFYISYLPRSRNLHGFALGKRYYYFGVRCRGIRPKLTLQRSEVTEYGWYNPTAALKIVSDLMQTQPADKTSHMWGALMLMRAYQMVPQP